MKTIYNFKKGDEIVRIQPAKPYSPKRMGVFGDEGGVRDRSYMGEKLIFVGIANGQIYCKRTDEFSLKIFGDKLLSLPLDVFDEGWESYIDPETLLENCENEIILDEETINQQIKVAVDNEDFELAERLKKKLNNRKK